jgi:hypothetical protein
VIPGLDMLSLPAAYVLASLAACPAPPPPTVTMEFTHDPAIERNDISNRDLGKIEVRTTFSKARNEPFKMDGITLNDFAPAYLVDFDSGWNPETQMHCLSVKSVKITVHYTPVIFIASEYRKGTCGYRERLLHEARHVNTDIITFKELLPTLQRGVAAAAAALGAAGPLKTENILPARDRMIDQLRQALINEVDKEEHVRFSRHQAIDTRHEYLRVTNACPGEMQPGR